MKATVSRLQRSVGIGGFLTLSAFVVIGYPIYLSAERTGTLATFILNPLTIQFVVLAAVFAVSAFVPWLALKAVQVLALFLFGLITLAGADIDSLTGLLIIGIGVILAAQYGYFRVFPKLKISVLTIILLIALLVQATQEQSGTGVSQTLLAFSYNATAVIGLIAAYVIVWRDATAEIASRQAALETAVEKRTEELSQEVAARLTAEQASREAAAEAERLAEERLALLREVHHRAKNSLQMVLALLEGMEVSSVESRDEKIDQVRAIGLVYDVADATQDLNAIPLEGYLENLVAHLRMAEHSSGLQIWFNRSTAIESKIESTVNLGLMIVEIVRIAKLSLTDGMGTITISETLAEDSLVFDIAYGGLPVPSEIDPASGAAAVTGLLPAFVSRLHVDLVIDRGELNTWSLRLPLEVLTASHP